jgi:hypothetical protein
MEITPSSIDEKPVPVRRVREKFMMGVLSVGGFLLMGPAVYFLRYWQASPKVKLVALLAGWLWVCWTLWYGLRYRREDELQILMNRRAFAFAFLAACVGVGILAHMEFVGIIPVLTLRTYHLFFALWGFLATGLIWSKIRYR